MEVPTEPLPAARPERRDPLARLLERVEDTAAAWLTRPGLIVIAFLLLLAAMAPGLARLGLDNSPERFFVRDAAALERYQRFEFDFGRDRTVRLVLEGDGLWTSEGLAWLEELEASAASTRGVLAVAGVYGHHRWRLDTWPPPDPERFRAEVLADPLDREVGWVSEDGSTLTVLVALYKLSDHDQKRALAGLEALLAAPPAGIHGWLTGLPVVQRALDRSLLEMAEIFFPILAAVAALLLWWAFRRPRDAARPLALVLVCQGTVFGAMGWAGLPADMVTVILVPLLFVVTLATAVHLQMRFLEERRRGQDGPAAARAMLRAKLWAVVWTGVTTAVGFGSLLLAEVPAVRALGLWSLAAFLFMTLAAVLFYPALLALTAGAGEPPPAPALERWCRRRGATWADTAVRRRGTTVAIFALAAALAVTGLPRLRSETSFLNYFRPTHPVRQGLDELTARGLGVLSAELVLTRPESKSGGFDRIEALETLRDLAAGLRAEPALLGVFGAGDLVDDIGRYLPAPPSATTSLETIRSVPDLDHMLSFFVTPDGRRARLTLMVPMAGYAPLEPVFERARRAAGAAFPGAAVEITGRYPMVLAARHTLLRTMFGSLALTLLVVAGVFRLVLRNTRLALRALLPNLWPVALVLGAMGWLGIGVDSTTVMIAAAALGLAVDDTFHTLGSFRHHLAGATAPDSARRAVGELAGAHTITTAVLAAGFAACAASSFLPVARFGALTALAVVAALVADLWLVPALLAGASDREVARLRSSGG